MLNEDRFHPWAMPHQDDSLYFRLLEQLDEDISWVQPRFLHAAEASLNEDK